MEFYIDKHSAIPVVNQIAEQIKFAVMMGIFRNGDTLPSIRDIEKQTGIHHSKIYKAYLVLRRSGLVVLTRGKGSVISTGTDSPHSANENCRKLSQQITSKSRKLGISPTAFTRYLSQHAQESERKLPFISYVDDFEEIASQTAAEISKLWQVPVRGLTFDRLKEAVASVASTQRILVNHILYEYTCSLLPGKKSSVIPIEVRVSEQTIKLLAGIQSNSSVLLIHLPQPVHRLHYMIAQLGKLIKSPGVKIHSATYRGAPDFSKLLSRSQYDYYLVGPAVRGEVPHQIRRDPRIVRINPQLDATSLETARIRAGVVI